MQTVSTLRRAQRWCDGMHAFVDRVVSNTCLIEERDGRHSRLCDKRIYKHGTVSPPAHKHILFESQELEAGHSHATPIVPATAPHRTPWGAYVEACQKQQSQMSTATRVITGASSLGGSKTTSLTVAPSAELAFRTPTHALVKPCFARWINAYPAAQLFNGCTMCHARLFRQRPRALHNPHLARHSLPQQVHLV